MPVGIDTEIFKPDSGVKTRKNALFLARMSPVKKPEILIEAINILARQNFKVTTSFYGNPSHKDSAYYQLLKNKVAAYDLGSLISFEKGITNAEAVKIYREHDIFINLSPSGMYDKTIFEAMACGTCIISCNKNLVGEIDNKFIFEEDNDRNLAEKIRNLMLASFEEKNQYRIFLRKYVEEKHSLAKLSEALAEELSQ